MSEHPFSLIAFPNRNIPDINISGGIARQNNILTIHYSLMGNAELIRFPEISSHPTRKDDLWRATCYEFFLAIPDGSQYWEFNMSPSGDWNIYHMDAYRRVGFREETSIPQLQFSIRRELKCVLVEAMVDLNSMFAVENPIQAGVTSVIQTKDGNETYWALSHPSSQADFHLRESFILELAG
jgi:hypothetical protein